MVDAHRWQRSDEQAREHEAYGGAPKPPVPRPQRQERRHRERRDQGRLVGGAHVHRETNGNAGPEVAGGAAPQEEQQACRAEQEGEEIGEREVEVVAPEEKDQGVERKNATDAERGAREQLARQSRQDDHAERCREQRPEQLHDRDGADPECRGRDLKDVAHERHRVAVVFRAAVVEQREMTVAREALAELPVERRVVVEDVVTGREEVRKVHREHEREAHEVDAVVPYRTLLIGCTDTAGDDVLPTEWHAREPLLEPAQRGSLPREEGYVARFNGVRPGIGQQAPGFGRSEQDDALVEVAPAHRHAGQGIEGIVLVERHEAAGPRYPRHLTYQRRAAARLDVVQDADCECDVVRAGIQRQRDPVERPVPHARVRRGRSIEQALRDVDTVQFADPPDQARVGDP